VIVVGWRTDGDRAATEDDGRQAAIADARAAVERLVADGIPRGEAARRVAAATGLPRRALYAAPAAVEPDASRRADADPP
jgi:hypothetical protein